MISLSALLPPRKKPLTERLFYLILVFVFARSLKQMRNARAFVLEFLERYIHFAA